MSLSDRSHTLGTQDRLRRSCRRFTARGKGEGKGEKGEKEGIDDARWWGEKGERG